MRAPEFAAAAASVPHDPMPHNPDELLAVVLAATNDGLWDWDLTTDQVSFSQRWKAMLGYEPEEISDRFEEWQLRVHPEDLERARATIEAYLTGELSDYELEHRLRHKDGAYRWICARGAALRDADGKARRFVGFHTDISDRKRAEQEMVEQRRTLATLLDNLPGMAYRCRNDPDWTMEFVSDGCLALTGFPADDFLAQRQGRYADLIHPEDRDGVWRDVQTALDERRPFRLTYRLTTATGEIKSVSEQGQGVFAAGGSLVALEGFVSDVTVRVRAEEQLRHRIAALAQMAATLTADHEMEAALTTLSAQIAAATEAVASAVVLIEETADGLVLPRVAGGSWGLPEGYIAALEPGWRQGGQSLTLEAFRSQRIAVVDDWRERIIPDPQFAALHPLLEDVTWGKIAFVPIIARGRSLGVLHAYFGCGHEPGPEEITFLGAIADMAAIAVETARLVVDAQDRAALEERQRLARELHDSVTQAVYALSLYTEASTRLLAAGDTETTADYLREMGETAREAMQEMRLLVFTLRPPILAQDGLVAAVRARLEAVEGRAGLQTAFDAKGIDHLPVDVEQALYRIAQEALNNVLKYARARSVSVALRREDGTVVLEIADDGIGFDATTAGRGGMGLRSMTERAEQLGGRFSIESGPDQGTRVRVEIRR